jgi:hypothetical protein
MAPLTHRDALREVLELSRAVDDFIGGKAPENFERMLREFLLRWSHFPQLFGLGEILGKSAFEHAPENAAIRGAVAAFLARIELVDEALVVERKGQIGPIAALTSTAEKERALRNAQRLLDLNSTNRNEG